MVQGYDQLIQRVLYGTLTDQQGQGFPAVLLGGNKHTMKRVGSILMIIFIMITFMIPYLRDPVLVFGADNLPSGYTPVTDDQELAQAFNAYCKSRDCEFTGTNEGAVYTYLYNDIKKGLGYLGYNIDELQEGLYAQYNSAGAISRFYWDSTSLGIANQLFAYFIRENDLEVGDSADLDLYSGKYFVDNDGNGCLIYVFPNASSNATLLGTPYKYSLDDLKSIITSEGTTITFHLTDSMTVTQTLYYADFTYSSTRWQDFCTNISSSKDKFTSRKYYLNNMKYGYVANKGNPAIMYRTDTGKYYFAEYLENYTGADQYNGNTFYGPLEITNNDNFTNANITFISNNIKQEYQGDTYITNEGDIVTNEGDTNINYNPYPDGGGTTSGPSSGNGGGGTDGSVDFPDLDFNLPEINWSLGDLSEKFPFSIPFDLISFFTVMNAEPVAPAIDKEIPLGDWYTWHFEADFSQFDDYAVIIRNVEFIGFVIALIYITIRLVKG